MMYTKQELFNSVEHIEKFEKYNNRDVYIIDGIERIIHEKDEEDYIIGYDNFLLSSVDTRDNPIKSIDDLNNILFNTRTDFESNSKPDCDYYLIQNHILYEYSSYNNNTLFTIFIDYEFGSNNKKEINSLLEKYYHSIKKDNSFIDKGLFIDQQCKLDKRDYRQEIVDAVKCIKKFEKYKQRDVYTIILVNNDDDYYDDLLSSVDTRDNPIKSMDELFNILDTSRKGWRTDKVIDADYDLIEDHIQYEYCSYDYDTLFAIFIDYEFGSSNEKEINSLWEKYYEYYYKRYIDKKIVIRKLNKL